METCINEIPNHAKTKYNKSKHTMNTMTQSNNGSHKKHICRNNDVYKMYSVSGVYPAEMREMLLSNDNNGNEKYKKPICKTRCPTRIARVNAIYTEILIDTGAELSVISHKVIYLNTKTTVNTKEKINKQIYVNITKDEWSWEIHCVVDISNL